MPSIWAPEPKRIIPPGLRRPIFPGERGWDEVWRLYGLINTGLVNDGHAMVDGGIIRAHVTTPADLFQDTFVEASPPVNLESHAPDIGTSWTKVTGQAQVVSSGSMRQTVAGNTYYYVTPSPSSANCYVQAVVNRVGTTQVILTFCLRSDGAASPNEYYVSLNFDSGSNCRIAIAKHVSGGETEFTSGNNGWGTSVSKTVKFTCSGTSLTMYINGSSVLTATDSTYSAAGKACFGSFFGNTTAIVTTSWTSGSL